MAHKYLMAIDSMNTAVMTAHFLKEILKQDGVVTIYGVISDPVMSYNTAYSAGVPLYADNREIFMNIENVQKDEIMKIVRKVDEIIAHVSKKNKGKI